VAEQAEHGRDRAGTSDDPAAEAKGMANPIGDGAGVAPVSEPLVRFDDHRGGVAAGVRVRRAMRTIMNLLAVTVRLVAVAFAVILLVRIGIAFIAVNPNNAIVEWIVRFSDIIVWGFRDLFLPADPRIGVAANYGLAAVFWLVVGLIAARVLSGFGRLVAGRNRF
jgi:hypothetical protein